MATQKLAPLPPDYARPTAAEFKAAGITHTTYEKFCEGHEAELRKHHKPAAEPAAPEPEPALELDELGEELKAGEAEPSPPWFNPRAATYTETDHELDDTRPMGAAPVAPIGRAALKPSHLPEGYVRPSLEEWQEKGYGRELTGAEAEAAHKQFFEAYEAGTATETPPSESASGELSPPR